jgi:hypothetical protein
MNSNNLSSIAVTYVCTMVPVTAASASRELRGMTQIGRGIVRKKGTASKEPFLWGLVTVSGLNCQPLQRT